MGKHETGYARIPRDLYPTPAWVIDAPAEHVDLRNLTVWECACGDGRMSEALKLAGCARVYSTDIADGYAGQDEMLDFLSGREPKLLPRFPDGIITNPPFGERGKLAERFIEAGLARIRQHGGILALLLPCDFDSAITRPRYFGDCLEFVGKIVLRGRVVWFKNPDPKKENPKENTAWFLWVRSPLRVRHRPIILYSARGGEQ